MENGIEQSMASSTASAKIMTYWYILSLFLSSQSELLVVVALTKILIECVAWLHQLLLHAVA